MQRLHDAVLQAIGEIKERKAGGGVDVIGLSTGFPEFDRVTGGLRKKAVYVLAGRTAMGKSSMALTMALHNAEQKKNTLFLSLEMDATLLAMRTLSGMTQIPAQRIERGRLSNDELQRVEEAAEKLSPLHFDITDRRIDSETLVERVREYHEKNQLDLLVVDYISLLRDSSKFGENERLSRIMGNIWSIANENEIPVLALAQLNREVERRENHMPILSDLRDSGSIEQDAFLVAFLYRPHYYAMMFDGEEPLEVERDAKILIPKNRQGEQGAIEVDFYPNQMRWQSKEVKIEPQPSLTPEPKKTLKERVQEGRKPLPT